MLGVNTLEKQSTYQRYILKIHSTRLRRARWNLTIPISEARRNDELVSLADSQMLTWIDMLNGEEDSGAAALEIRKEIRSIRKEPNSLQNRRRIKKLYEQLDAVQFKPDYLCIIMDKEKDYHRARRGLTVNGVKYKRLLGTNGGVKNKTIVFVSERLRDELWRRVENGRDAEVPLVPAKLEAYKALTCSASTPVSMPKGILVVNDCETSFRSDVIYISDEQDGEPVMVQQNDMLIELNESDGYGLMTPSLASRWGQELGLDYIPGGVNTRFSWTKGMAFCFDFLDFANNVAKGYVVKDAWGHDKDIRDIELILTTSMLKLWDSYDSIESYLECCNENGYQFRITKACPKTLESERTLNYQFIQSYNLSDEDLEELIAPTMNEIKDVLSGDWRKTVLFLKGSGLNERNVAKLPDDFAKALMIDSNLLNDPFVKDKVYQLIRNRIKEAKIGVLKVHGNYSVVAGDPYSLCQSILGLEVTGLLSPGEIYNSYWAQCDSNKLVCFRAPMTCHNNIRGVSVHRSPEAAYWYRYMNTCTLLNSFDTIAMAENGCDKDGDIIMLTDNRVLIENHRPMPAIMCAQKKADKKIVTEDDLVQSNIDSFGDDIGKITNRITSMFEVQSRFKPGDKEYEVLDYRIKCGQLLQQNSIDKSKGIISKQMPRAWYDWRTANAIEDGSTREMYIDILADKKPSFMRHIYPSLMRKCNEYERNTNKKSQREFGKTVAELFARDPAELGVDELAFTSQYLKRTPVGNGDCVVNRICKRFEEEFDSSSSRHKGASAFDYKTMRGDSDYSNAQFYAVHQLLMEYVRRLQDYKVFAARERVEPAMAADGLNSIHNEFRVACEAVCPNAKCLCDIMLDVCYQRGITKQFVWSTCGKEIIKNLLSNNGGLICFPVLDLSGDIKYGGQTYSLAKTQIEVND